MNDFIKIHNMDCSLENVKILKNINLNLKSSTFTSLIGDNGSGKTVLSKVIVGIYKYEKGNVKIEDKEVKAMKLYEIGGKIGYLFQNPEKQIFNPTVYEELAFGLKYKNISREIIEEKVDNILKVFEMEHLRNSTTFFLSQGEKQRLAIASIILNEPKYLILDEPTTGLDIKRKKILGKLLNKFRDKIGILLISHDKDFINKYSERIIRIKNGCIADEI